MEVLSRRRIGDRRPLLLIAAMAVLLLRAWPCRAGEVANDEKAPPSIAAVQVTGPPLIDGKLDDACWQQASHIAGLWRTDHDAPELEKTEAWLCYTSKGIYVAFRCYDSEPAAIKATQKKRQGSFGDDDWVGFWLDVTNKGSGFYSFRVNPAGTQYDSTPGGTSEKVEWKGDWRAAAAVDETGWSAEMEIPFSVLRYPKGQDCFRFDVSRQLARKQDYAIWPAGFARTFDADTCARWTGIATPPVPFRSCFMPYALSVFSEDDEDRDPLTAGLDYKGTFPNGVVGMATINPDFRNLEDVVETIDFTYVERFLPEYRPFFQEGRGFFPPSSIFYSRRIEEFDWGVKSFGQIGLDGFGVFDAYSRGGGNHLIWSFDHQMGTNSHAAVFGASPRLPDEPRNTTAGVYVDRGWPFEGGSKYVMASWIGSRTGGEGGDDQRCELQLGQDYNAQGLGWGLSYSAVGSDFVAQDGYVPETGVRMMGTNLRRRNSYDEGALQAAYWRTYYDAGQSEDGRRRGSGLEGVLDWRNGVTLSGGANFGVRDGFDDSGYWIGGLWTRNDRFRTGGWGMTWWEVLGYSSEYQQTHQAFRISDRWYGEIRLERSRSAEFADDGETVLPPDTKRQMILTHSYDLSDERTVSGRMVMRDGNTNFYLAYRQRVRKGTDVLIVVGDPNADEWVSRLAVKAMWCY